MKFTLPYTLCPALLTPCGHTSQLFALPAYAFVVFRHVTQWQCSSWVGVDNDWIMIRTWLHLTERSRLSTFCGVAELRHCNAIQQGYITTKASWSKLGQLKIKKRDVKLIIHAPTLFWLLPVKGLRFLVDIKQLQSLLPFCSFFRLMSLVSQNQHQTTTN